MGRVAEPSSALGTPEMSFRFDSAKAEVLRALVEFDRSPKGSVDAPIRELVARINATPDYVTTSSCSGRICVFAQWEQSSREKEWTAGAKGSGHWLLVEHREVGLEEVEAAVRTSLGSESAIEAAPESGLAETTHASFRPVTGAGPSVKGGAAEAVLSAEPFVLHVLCRHLEAAHALQRVAHAAGFKESGIVLGKTGRVMFHIRTTSNVLACPVVVGGAALVGAESLAALVDHANRLFRANALRVKRLEGELDALFCPAVEAGAVSAVEDSASAATDSLGLVKKVLKQLAPEGTLWTGVEAVAACAARTDLLSDEELQLAVTALDGVRHTSKHSRKTLRVAQAVQSARYPSSGVSEVREGDAVT
jgi:tRNA(Phe) wybutosine-synthesizing methylase Tyw3